MIASLRRNGTACDAEVHPATGMAIIVVPEQGEPPRFVMFYDPLDDAAQHEVARRVAAFFRQTDVLIDGDDPRDPTVQVEEGRAIPDNEPCSFQTRLLADLIAVTGRDPTQVSFNDCGALDQMARLYVEAGGPDVARYVGTPVPWEDQRDSIDILDWTDRFDGLDRWCKSDGVGLDGLRALCDQVVSRLAGASSGA